MFKLHFDIPPLTQKIALQDTILMLGSCFVDGIGKYLEDHKFQVSINPLGTLFNPISIFNGLNIGLEKQPMQPLEQRNDLYFSWDAHSRWSGHNQAETRTELKNTFQQIGNQTRNASWIMITPGTAHVYEWQGSGHIVANCHKFPQQKFNKRLLSVSEITKAFQEVYKNVTAVNPNVNWLFTISPVRHMKDGLIENNLSKSVLIQAVSEIIHGFERCHYFPAYEIMIDELRDYRFYKEDMIHPGAQAIAYIWEAFQKAGFNDATQVFVQRWSKMLSALRHRPLHSNSQEHQLFLQATRRKLRELENMIDITAELKVIDEQIQT